MTGPPAATGPIHLVVDLNRCQGYAQCCFLAPSVFTLHGEEALWYDPAPDAAEREHVLRAAAACPVQAIRLEAQEPASPQPVSHQQSEAPHAAQRS
jgi:ferredoxin